MLMASSFHNSSWLDQVDQHFDFVMESAEPASTNVDE